MPVIVSFTSYECFLTVHRVSKLVMTRGVGMFQSSKAFSEVTFVLSMGPVFDVSSTSSVAASMVISDLTAFLSVESVDHPKMTAVVYAPIFGVHV